MLKPLGSPTRLVVDLSGTFRARWDGGGEPEDLLLGRGYDKLLAVPAAWNYQYPELYQYRGDVWYCREFYVPEYAGDRDMLLRFEAANEHAQVYLNGRFVGEHFGGYLPFEVDITRHVQFNQANVLAVRVDTGKAAENSTSAIADDANEYTEDEDLWRQPADFAFGGLVRPVRLLILPRQRITGFNYALEQREGGLAFTYDVRITGGRVEVEMAGTVVTGEKGAVELSSPRLWSPEDPFLYAVSIRLYGPSGTLVDEYVDRVGLRSVGAGKTGLAVNGKDIFLRGTSRHEDFPVVGSGEVKALYLRDLAVMRFLGMNTLRPGRCPPSWELADLCDRLGMMLVVQCPEVPGIWSEKAEPLPDETAGDSRKKQKVMVEETVAFLRNHPSVVAWSVVHGAPSHREGCADFLRDLCLHVKDMDPSRAVVFANTSGMSDKAADAFDLPFVELRHRGRQSPEEFAAEVTRTVDGMYHRHGRPVLVGGLGDGLDGGGRGPEHTRARALAFCLDEFDKSENLCGTMVWCLADYVGSGRSGAVTYKEEGILTRDREPKEAAWELHKRYSSRPADREGTRAV